MFKDFENLNESKLMSNIALNIQDNKTFTKNVSKGTAPKASDIQNMLKSINKKEGK